MLRLAKGPNSDLESDAAWKKIRLPFVDDTRDFRTLAQDALQSLGVAEVRSVAVAMEALDLLRGFAADLMVVEVQLPDVNGVRLIRILRDPVRSPTPASL